MPDRASLSERLLVELIRYYAATNAALIQQGKTGSLMDLPSLGLPTVAVELADDLLRELKAAEPN